MPNKYPKGKISEGDQGEVKTRIYRSAENKIVINFGKDVTWIAMDPSEARELAQTLNNLAGWEN